MPLFDLLRFPETLTERDLETLAHFGVSSALVAMGASAEAAREGKSEIARLRRAGIAAYLTCAPHPDLPPGGTLEVELQCLPRLLSSPRAVALGPVGLSGGHGAQRSYALERVLALAKTLRRPVIVRGRGPGGDPRDARRVLSIVRESGLPPELLLGVSLSRSALTSFRACGHAIGLSLSRTLPAKTLVEVVNRFGSERVLLLGEGADFLSLPKAVALLEEAKVPGSVIRRISAENARRFLKLEASP